MADFIIDSSDDRSRALEALRHLAPWRADDREQWLLVGMALHSEGDDRFDAWEEWSKQSDKFDAKDCARQWKSFKADGGVTVATLFAMAKEDSAGTGMPAREEHLPAPAPKVVPRQWNDLIGRLEGPLGSLVAFWSYGHAGTSEELRVARFQREKKKTYRPLHLQVEGWVVGDPKGPLPIYHRLELGSDADPLFVVEGEKCVEIARDLGLFATTSAHGAASPQRSDWSPAYGRKVICLPDNNDAGRRYVSGVGEILRKGDQRTSVRVVELPGLPPGGDIEDFVLARRAEGLADNEIHDLLLELAASAPELVVNAPGSLPQGGCGSNGSAGEEESDDFWPMPEPLPDGLPEVAEFDLELLPKPFRGFVRDVAERTQCPIDFIAVPMMIVEAAVVGRKIVIRPKRHDDWEVVVNLWGGVIGRSGVMKSPAIKQAFSFLEEIEEEANKEYARQLRESEAQALVEEAVRSQKRKALKKAVEQGDDPMGLAKELLDTAPESLTPPRIVVNDSTVEKLGELLNENKNGLCLFRDELTGFLRSLDKQGHEGARAFYLESWNGNSAFTYDRIGRGTIRIEHALMSIFGGVQPGPLKSYMLSAMSQSQGDDGFLQRFQLLTFPDVSPDWKNIDVPPDLEERQAVRDVLVCLYSLSPTEIGAQIPDSDGEDQGRKAPFLRFDDEAQEMFDEWRPGLELRVRSGEEHPAIESHLAKYRSLVPSLALLIHLAEGVGPVCADALRRAIGWAEYLESHMRRIYSDAADPDQASAILIGKKLLAGKLDDEFSARDVYRRKWAGLTDREGVKSGLEVLVELDWLEEIHVPNTRGKGKFVYQVNPRIFEIPTSGTDITANTGATAGSGSSVSSEVPVIMDLVPGESHPSDFSGNAQVGTAKTDTSGARGSSVSNGSARSGGSPGFLPGERSETPQEVTAKTDTASGLDLSAGVDSLENANGVEPKSAGGASEVGDEGGEQGVMFDERPQADPNNLGMTAFDLGEDAEAGS